MSFRVNRLLNELTGIILATGLMSAEMKANVKLFAILREKAGVTHLTLEIPDTSTVTDLINEINHRYPKLKDTGFLSRVAVNAEYVDVSHRLKAGDEIALIPPVSGGAISRGDV